MPRTMADILQGLIESGLDSVATEKHPQPIVLVSDPPVSSCAPWVDFSRVRASTAHDVLERQERSWDDRTFEQRSADATRARAVQVAAQRVKWRFTFSSKAAAKPKAEKSTEHKAHAQLHARSVGRGRRLTRTWRESARGSGRDWSG